MASPRGITLPGQHLGAAETTNIGTGTYVRGGQIYSSVCGAAETTRAKSNQAAVQAQKQKSQTKTASTSTISVSRPGDNKLVPGVQTVVLGRVTRTTGRQANLSIVALGANGEEALTSASEGFPAIIRQQDIRATEIDKVRVGESFRVGDVVRALVISLGDERAYYCSTARDDLGVVLAVSEWGNRMAPASWREFVDPVTGARESRKVAKPV